QLSGPDDDYRVDTENLSNRGQRRLLDERRTRPAQVALVVRGPHLVEALRDRKIQKGVTEKLQPLVVQAGRAPMRQSGVEQRGVCEAVIELLLGPSGARAH